MENKPFDIIIEVLTPSGEFIRRKYQDIEWANPRAYKFAMTPTQDLQYRSIAGACSGGVSFIGFKITSEVKTYFVGNISGSMLATWVLGSGFTLTGLTVGAIQSTVSRSLINHYTNVNFREYQDFNSGRVFVNERGICQLLPNKAFLVIPFNYSIIRIVTTILSFNTISFLYGMMGESTPSIRDTSFKGRRLLTSYIIGRIWPTSMTKNNIGLSSNLTINFEYGFLSTMISIIIIKLLIWTINKRKHTQTGP